MFPKVLLDLSESVFDLIAGLDAFPLRCVGLPVLLGIFHHASDLLWRETAAEHRSGDG
jgi:hypothetical protein